MKSFKYLGCFCLLGIMVLMGNGCSEDQPLQPDVAAMDVPTTSPLATDLIPNDPTGGPHNFPDFVETFDGEEIEGNWSFFGNKEQPFEYTATEGGNPGAFLHSPCNELACLDTYAPQLRTELGTESIFTGDYQARGVETLGVDLAVFGPEILTTLGRPLSLILSYDPKTPTDPNDDIQVVYVGNRNIPQANGQFKKYWFHIPSDSKGLPEGWVIRLGRGTGDDDADWDRIIHSVDQVFFFFGDPDYFFMLQQWELGADNPCITYSAE